MLDAMATESRSNRTVDLGPSRSGFSSPPLWFRFTVLTAATLILCSCQSASRHASHNPREMDHLAVTSERLTPADMPPERIFDRNIELATFDSPWRGNRQCNPQSGLCNSPSPPCPTCISCPTPAAKQDEFLCDGGDDGLPVGVRPDWTIDGLEQEDTIAHYDTVDGRTLVTPSNRVCIYAPRFGAVRRVVDLRGYARYDQTVGMEQNLALAKIDEQEEAATSLALLEPSIHRARQPSSLLRERQQAGELDRERRVAETDGLLAPYANLQIIQSGTISNDERARVARSVLSAITWTGDQTPQIVLDSKQAVAAVHVDHLGIVYQLEEPNSPKLRLVKLASRGSAKPGEEVEFTLRFDNIGNRIIGNVTLADNLTTRLEYLPDSAHSSLEADFTATPNDAGGQILRWELRAPLKPGAGGIVKFRCKVL
jgi:uncharacterized repeat protein (TIGR01451 family)